MCWLVCAVCCQLSVVSCRLYDIHLLLIVFVSCLNVIDVPVSWFLEIVYCLLLIVVYCLCVCVLLFAICGSLVVVCW